MQRKIEEKELMICRICEKKHWTSELQKRISKRQIRQTNKPVHGSSFLTCENREKAPGKVKKKKDALEVKRDPIRN